MTKFRLIIMILACFVAGAVKAEVKERVMPDRVAGISLFKLLLNGEWQFQYSVQSKWTTIQVPGEVAMQGYAIEHDKPFVYKKQVSVPVGFAGKKTILRFDGVYSHAKLYVNGTFVREHFGGFTRWETDVTDQIKAGRKNEIKLEVTDRLDDISYASGYAHHPIGGILRDVTLYALPQVSIADFAADTEMDTIYRDAKLKIAYQLEGDAEATVRYELYDPQGKKVNMADAVQKVKTGSVQHTFSINNPAKWDAEHPNLYKLNVSVEQAGKETYRFSRNIGFRKIEVKGTRLLVNGMPVKLRGACRHDIHPTLGRTTTAELDSLDVILFKESNMNFVRTSHYPPSEKFIEFCDRYGIYVESETAVCFVDTYRQKNYAPGKSQNDLTFADRYLGQCQEMVKNFRTHPSVIMWSIGNESVYGTNFQICYDWVKAADQTRHVIFSYPGLAEKDKKVYDILSFHYQDTRGNVDQYGLSTRGFQSQGMPALFDEWAHPACYTYATLQTDPNIREFWGKSLDLMWSGLFDAPGGLGGAIWGYIDETFALPIPKEGAPYWKEFARTAKPADYQGNCVGYGEWGIVDVWRREKPEFWSTKKAYSPVRMMTEQIRQFTPGVRLTMTLHNRFDHTNISEITASYTYKGVKKNLQLPSILPHQKGMLTVPGEKWEQGEKLLIEFSQRDGRLIDAYQIAMGDERIDYPEALAAGKLSIEENDESIIIRGTGFEVPFDKKTGLMTNVKVGNETLIEKGPFLNLYINLNHLSGAEVRKTASRFVTSDEDWQKDSFSYREAADGVYVELSGSYHGVTVDFKIKISQKGQLHIDYNTIGAPNGFLRETGVMFYLPEMVEKLEWRRKGYWNYYPEGSFAGNSGSAALYTSHQSAYGQQPVQAWQEDSHNYFYWADAGANCKKPLTQMAKGMKENVYYYTLRSSLAGKHQLSILSADASVACRINKLPDEQLVLYVNNHWDYPEIAWGNFCKTIEALPCYGSVKMQLSSF